MRLAHARIKCIAARCVNVRRLAADRTIKPRERKRDVGGTTDRIGTSIAKQVLIEGLI